MTFLVIVIVVGFVIWAVLGVKKDGDISKKGIMTEAVVSRVEDHETEITDARSEDFGKIEHSYTYYVKYTTKDGREVEAKLGTPRGVLEQGDKIKIKYLPDKTDYVLQVEVSR